MISISISILTSDRFLASVVPFDSSPSSSSSSDDLSFGSDSGLGPRFGCPFSSMSSFAGHPRHVWIQHLRQQLLPPQQLPLKPLRASQSLVSQQHVRLQMSSR